MHCDVMQRMNSTVGNCDKCVRRMLLPVMPSNQRVYECVLAALLSLRFLCPLVSSAIAQEYVQMPTTSNGKHLKSIYTDVACFVRFLGPRQSETYLKVVGLFASGSRQDDARVMGVFCPLFFLSSVAARVCI